MMSVMGFIASYVWGTMVRLARSRTDGAFPAASEANLCQRAYGLMS
jgi:hypothetical protein